MTTIDIIDGALTVVWEERSPGQIYTGRVQFAPQDTSDVQAIGAMKPAMWDSVDRRLPKSIAATVNFVHVRNCFQFFPDGTAYCHGYWYPTWRDAALSCNFPIEFHEEEPQEDLPGE